VNTSNNPSGADGFIELLERHADQVLRESGTNQLYAETVKRRARMVEGLLNGEIETIRGVVSTWTDDIKPIAEAVFGEGLDGHFIGEHEDYSPTIFPGVSARIRMLSSDEMLGPTLSLDMSREPA
jgi:hypothetical protein